MHKAVRDGRKAKGAIKEHSIPNQVKGVEDMQIDKNSYCFYVLRKRLRYTGLKCKKTHKQNFHLEQFGKVSFL
jgi:hypothetical protein